MEHNLYLTVLEEVPSRFFRVIMRTGHKQTEGQMNKPQTKCFLHIERAHYFNLKYSTE